MSASTTPVPLRRRLPGITLVVAMTALAYAIAGLVGTLVSPLLLALLLGVLWRTVAVREEGLGTLSPGVAVAAGPLLRLGIVALGVRLDARLLVDLGPIILAGSLLGVAAAFLAVELVGRAWRAPADLRALMGIGTAICGASAIVAAAPVWRARPEHAATGIAAISLVGTVGVLGFAAWDAVAPVPLALFAALAGATLQEVGQVVAAGSVQGPEGADVALLVKLSRVVLLAPVLVAFGWLARAADGATASRAAAPAAEAVDAARTGAAAPDDHARPRPPLVPPFVVGFLVLGGAVSAGLIPPLAVAIVSLAGSLLIAAAMAAIGLGVNVRAMRGAGVTSLALAAVGMAALGATMILYYALALP